MTKKLSFCCLLLVALVAARFNGSAGCDDEIGTYELTRGQMSMKVTNYGATMMSFKVPDKNGNMDDIILGFDTADGYKNDTTYFGAIVGRVANRIGKAQFKLDGKLYKLPPNDGKNMLHGGANGFSEVIWKVQEYEPDSHITFTYESFDGEEGFPGKLSVSVTYMLVGTNKLRVKMTATPHDKATPVNLALHTYWNLGGHKSGDILSHILKIYGREITPVNNELIPTGKIVPVKGTPYDFLEPHKISCRINELPGGYDINYVLEGCSSEYKKAAEVHENVKGRTLELWTNQPGLQFYTSNMFDGVKGKDGSVYPRHAALCLETQGFPDSVNHPKFPSQIVRPGETYEQIMVFRFTASE